ncbi:MAG: hypothetical protein M1823_001026 [Watsoniomyces obsoletus]|nr:MAG: hypothetical protein M1823_001026 [Watsoniomyces obsoletus]
MLSSTSPFVNTTLSVDQNAVKSLLFRAAALMLQFAVLKLFSLWASWRKAFTAYLVFAEDYIQRALYVKSHRFTINGLLVLAFTLFVAAAGFYDTLLWGLDAPGYVEKKSRVRAAQIVDRRAQNPNYVILQPSRPEDLSTLDKQLEDEIGANLYQPGFNFTLVGEVDRGSRKIVEPTRPLDAVGPRIWLDEEGFSVSTDSWVHTVMELGRNGSESLHCPPNVTTANSWAWACTYPNTHTIPVTQKVLGLPEIHWDDASDQQIQSQYLNPSREDNPWAELGTGGGSVAMQQVFTVTKGRQRHTFWETVYKGSLFKDYDRPLPRDEVTDLVKRTWSTDPSQQEDPIVDTIAGQIMKARADNSSFMRGFTVGRKTSVAQATWDLINLEVVLGNVTYSLMRVSFVNITLIRSETLPEEVKPAEPCEGRFYRNVAIGGKVQGTDCHRQGGGNHTRHRFFGEIDTTAVLIFNRLLGDGRNVSAKAWNQTTVEWYFNQENRIQNLLLARGFLLGVDANLVTVEVSTVKAAISYLQIFLMLIAGIVALISWGSTLFFADPHYSNSLLANLFAATATSNPSVTDGEEPDSNPAKIKPGYLHDMAEIQLCQEGDRTVMETSTGVFRLVDKNNGIGHHHHHHPGVPGDVSTNRGSSNDGHSMFKPEMHYTIADVMPTPPPVAVENDPLLFGNGNADRA